MKSKMLLISTVFVIAGFVLTAVSYAQSSEPPATQGTEVTTQEQTPAPEQPAAPEPPAPPVEPKLEEVTPPPPPPPPQAQEEGIPIVESSWGKMKLGGVLQAQLLFTDLADEKYFVGTKQISRDIEFNLARMRIILTGSFLKDKVSYLIQGDMVNTDGFLLDARASIKPIKALEIRFGRFIPDFTYFMPMNVGKLMVIDYPLVTSSFSVWRQVGLELIFDQPYFSITAGVFNGMRFASKTITPVDPDDPAKTLSLTVSDTALAPGYMSANPDNLTDDNLGKDFLFRFLLKPVKGLEFAPYVWYGMPQYTWYESGKTTKNETGHLLHFGVEARYLRDNLSILAEYAMRRIYYPDGAQTPEADPTKRKNVSPDPLVAHGAFVHFGYIFIKRIEPMLRLDYYDKDIDSDLGQEIWGTVGLNYYIDGLHARLTGEYILKVLQRDKDTNTTAIEAENFLVHNILFQLCLMI